jgi:ABC-type multidrug transport system ATPase subunit/ABC-type multidrug transport system permease subunit
MNDILLSGLLNLFALFGAVNRTDKSRSLQMLSNYLTKHFGVRMLDDYLPLYSDLRDFYDISPELDKDAIIEGICSNIKHKISREDQTLMLLRLMEFCDPTPGSGKGESIAEENMQIFRKVAELFEVDGDIFADFVCYVSGDTNAHVLTLTREGMNGELRLINLERYNKILFSYNGPDTVLMNDIPVLPGTFLVWQQSGVLKSRHMLPLYYSNISALYDSGCRKHEIVLSGRDINFRFPGSDNGMHDLTFDLRSGQLVAVMGGSGTGKSTLLSLLNGTIPPDSGSITLNGRDISDPKVKDLIGFVPQDDLLIEELTVYENLMFTARLCFADLSMEEISARVDTILRELGLESTKHLKVGSPIHKYISGGQRKRLNIALELIREPAVLFLDEPTSGLSSSDSEKVINLLKEQTYKGKLIVVNIHQPSSDIFKLFDRLWLLDRGGYPVYDGNPIEAVTYFKRAANYADAEISTCSLCGNVNPEIILNIIDEKALDDSGKITDSRKVTPQEWHRMYLERVDRSGEPEHRDIPHTEQKRPPRLKQLLIFLQRNLRAKLPDSQYLLITIAETPLLAMIVALLTRYAPESGYTVMDNKNLVSYIFMAVIVAIFAGMSVSAEEIFKDRALLKREKFLRLSRSAYLWSKILYLAGVSLIQTLLFILVGNTVMGIGFTFWIWWLILFLSSMLANLTGLILSQSLNSIVAIYVTIPLLLIPQILLCGLVVKFDDLTPRSTTGNVPIIGDLIPSRWAFEALAVGSFAYNDFEKMTFPDDKVKYQSQYYRTAFIYELESRLESGDSADLEIVRHGIPELSERTGIRPYGGSTDSIRHGVLDTASINRIQSWLSYAEDTLGTIGNRATLAADSHLTAYRDAHGRDALIKLRRDNCNGYLETLVTNSSSPELYSVIGNTIVPKAGQIWLDPPSRNGRAPFYSSVKIIGNLKINTVIYNIAILLLMCIAAGILLFADIPGRFMRKH